MKKIVVSFIIAALSITFLPAFSADAASKGASSKAYEKASEHSVFERISDWFSTIGKSEEEKAEILKERKAGRAGVEGEGKTKKKIGKKKFKTKKARKGIKGKKIKAKKSRK